jgi:pilus assembly protein CpaC
VQKIELAWQRRRMAIMRMLVAVCGVLLLGAVEPMQAAAQQIMAQPTETVLVERGKSALLAMRTDIVRVSLADESIADAITMPPREIVINGRNVGTTTLVVWTVGRPPQLFTIQVTADVTALQDQLRQLFPGEDIRVTVSANMVILSGTVRDATVVRRALELAAATGATVINNIQAPSPAQILLHVRIAEVRRSALSRLGVDLFAGNVGRIGDVFGDGSVADIETLSEGIVRLFLLGQDAQLEAIIRALRSTGDFRSLAEPNLLAMEGQQATFLAGGEFPYPVVQAGAAAGQVTIQFREFGVKLNFTPQLTNLGAIRLRVEPEVSSLDFAGGLTFAGFQIPTLLTRRVSTEVELRPGQHLAIAGLLDNSMMRAVDKIPFLGDLPILGALFRTTTSQQDRGELIVVVTPHIVQPMDTPPPLPTGEPELWRWDRRLRGPANPAAPPRRRDN